jgi:hypothetical protein
VNTLDPKAIKEARLEALRAAVTSQPEIGYFADLVGSFKNVKRFTARVEPMGAPRQSRVDRWNPRDCVLKYRETKDKVREAAGVIDQNAGMLFCLFYRIMPASWSNKKKLAMCGVHHRVKPDTDNSFKLVQDAIFEQDSGVYAIFGHKVWCNFGEQRIEVTVFS